VVYEKKADGKGDDRKRRDRNVRQSDPNLFPIRRYSSDFSSAVLGLRRSPVACTQRADPLKATT
jgi:hypothetical protein